MPKTRPPEANLTTLPQLAERITAEHALALDHLGRGLAHALECGRLLVQAKGLVPRGQWLAWLREHCPKIRERMAERYMRVAQKLPRLDAADPTRVSDLSLRQALEMITYTEEATQTLGSEAAEAEAARVPEAVWKVRADQRKKEKELKRARWKEEQAKRLQAQQQRIDIQERSDQFGPPPPLPDPTENQFNLLGFDPPELEVVQEALAESAQWYEQLQQRLATQYEYVLPRMASDVASAIWELRRRLTYDREQLQHAVFGLRELLATGPLRGQEVRAWAKKAGISQGLLALARRIVDVYVVRRQGRDWWSLPGEEESIPS